MIIFIIYYYHEQRKSPRYSHCIMAVFVIFKYVAP